MNEAPWWAWWILIFATVGNAIIIVGMASAVVTRLRAEMGESDD